MMKQILHTVGAVLAVALVASACVTKDTYQKLEAEKNQEIAALQAERQALQQQRAELQQQIEKLDAQRSALDREKKFLEQESVALQTRVGLLGGERAELEKQQAALRQQIEALEQQKTQLLAKSTESQQQYETLVRNLKDEVQKGQLQVKQYKNMLTVDVAEQLFFESGQASLKETGKAVLKKVGDTLKAYDDKVIRIIGHTDNVPIAKNLQKTFPSNWELSVARATTVVRYLQEIGIPPERLIASGRAHYAPVASNDTAEGRRKNRRIEITLIDRTLAQEIEQTAR